MKTRTFVLLASAVAALAVVVHRMGTAALANAARRQPIGTPASLLGGQGAVVYDYFAGRSADQVLANPGPMYQRDVIEYPDETARGVKP